MATIQIPLHVELTVTRPSGIVETVIPKPNGRVMKTISPREFAAFVANTKAAGHGDVTGYRVVTQEVEAPQPSAADIADMEYRKHVASVYRAMDAAAEFDTDNTPSHKNDY